MITILFFAQLREQLNCEKISVHLDAPLTIMELRDYVIQQHPHWGTYLTNEKLVCALNQKIVKTSQLVNNNDEVAFFPPVTGG